MVFSACIFSSINSGRIYIAPEVLSIFGAIWCNMTGWYIGEEFFSRWMPFVLEYGLLLDLKRCAHLLF